MIRTMEDPESENTPSVGCQSITRHHTHTHDHTIIQKYFSIIKQPTCKLWELKVPEETLTHKGRTCSTVLTLSSGSNLRPDSL